jgi:chromosome segregation ATPase
MRSTPVAVVRSVETEQSWSQKVAKARELRGKSMGLLFDRMAILVEVYEDQAFLDTFRSLDDALEALDVEVSDTACDWMELHGIYRMFPDRKAWATAKLQDLRAKREIAERERRTAQREESDEPPRKRTVATVRELEEAKQTAGEFSQRVESQSKQIERLLAENEALKTELAKYQGRVEELEKLLSSK